MHSDGNRTSGKREEAIMADRRPVVVLALTLVVLLGLVLRASGKPVTTMAHGPKGNGRAGPVFL